MTGDTWLALYPGKILALDDLKTNLTDSIRAAQVQVQSDLWGTGGMLDTLATGSIGGGGTDEFTLTSDRNGWTPSGHRLDLDSTASEWISVPFEGGFGTAQEIAARYAEVPVSAELGTDGQPHFASTVERVAEILQPATVATAGSGLLLTMTGSMSLGSRWPTSTNTRPVVVWYQDANGDPVVASSAAIETGTLVKNGANYEITTTGQFGQSTPSTDPTRYRVAILGPAFYRDTELPTDWATEYLQIGINNFGVFSSNGKPLINNVGDWIAAFNVQHNNSTGVHLDVTADRVDVGTPSGVISAAGRVRAESVHTNAVQARNVSDGLTVNTILAEQANGVDKVALRAGQASVAGGGGELAFLDVSQASDNAARITTNEAALTELLLTNLNTGTTREMRIQVDGRIRKNTAKTGVPFALQTNTTTADELGVENLGTGQLDLRLVDGNVLLTVGDVSAGGDVFGTDFNGATVTLLSGSIDASGNLSMQGYGAFGAYVSSDPVTSGIAGYQYAQAVDFMVDVSPVSGGWSVTDPVNDNLQLITGTPSYARTNSTSIVLNAHYSLSPWLMGEWNQSGSTTLQIVGVEMDASEVSGSTLILYLRRQLRDGSGSVGTVSTLSAATTLAGVYATVSNSFTHTVNPLYRYWLELYMDSNTSVTNIRVQRVNFTIRKLAVE